MSTTTRNLTARRHIRPSRVIDIATASPDTSAVVTPATHSHTTNALAAKIASASSSSASSSHTPIVSTRRSSSKAHSTTINTSPIVPTAGKSSTKKNKSQAKKRHNADQPYHERVAFEMNKSLGLYDDDGDEEQKSIGEEDEEMKDGGREEDDDEEEEESEYSNNEGDMNDAFGLYDDIRDEDDLVKEEHKSMDVDDTAPKVRPFIFNPQQEPTPAAREQSEKQVQQRLTQFLQGCQLVGTTTAAQRMRMTKDALLQRNIEIQSLMVQYDRDYDKLLNLKPTGWQVAVAELDTKNDALAEESDDIETILFESFRVVGGGRSLLSDEVIHASHVGSSMADQHRLNGMPIPKLSTPITSTPAAISSSSAAAAASSSSSAAARTSSHTLDLLSPVNEDSMGDSAATPAAALSLAAAPSTSTESKTTTVYSATSRSDGAMFQRLDAAQEATRIRREERKAKAKESVLGKYMDYFNRFVDVEPKEREKRINTPKKPAKVQHFTHYLGTIVFPLFTDADGIRAFDQQEDDAQVKIEDEGKVDPPTTAAASSSSATTAVSSPSSSSLPISSPSSQTRKRRRSISDEAESDERKNENDDNSSESDESPEPSGEEVWLDFMRDESFLDGCIVRQTRDVPNSLENNTTQTIIIGLLPLSDLHPVIEDSESDDEQPLVDENGEPFKRKPKPKPMPDASHPLAALYILQEANIIRCESTLVRADPSSPSQFGSRDLIYVTVLLNSRIYDCSLLRSIAQKSALRTLFHLFHSHRSASSSSSSSSSSSQEVVLPFSQSKLEPTRYTNSRGQLVYYAELSDKEKKMVAYSESLNEPEDEEHQEDQQMIGVDAAPKINNVISQHPANDGVAPMDIDDDDDAEEERKESIPPKPTASISVAGPSDSLSPSSSQRVESNKRRKIVPEHLSLADQAIDGESIGESDDDQEVEDEEDGSEEEDSEDELCETYSEDELVFVSLTLPESEDSIEVDEDIQPKITVKLEPNEVTHIVAVPEMTPEELASYRQINTKSLELDHDTGGAKLNEEEQQLEAENTKAWRPDTLHTLFESIRPTPKWTKYAAQPSELVSTLRPFQQKALAWMIERESSERATDEYDDPLWEEVKVNGRIVYYQPFAGFIQKEKPPKRRDVRGGILADEMGLGKTVVAIALILKSPWSDRPMSPREKIMTDRSEPDALVEQALPRIGATLVVSPMSLVYQWQKEIQLHAPSLKVHIYEGTPQSRTSDEADKVYQEQLKEFREADVILTNYAVLGAEVNYSRECKYSFRGSKLYAVPKSPLLDCHFHRFLLDEAQMVHSSLSVCFKMAARIHATSKFCVSGTPIGPQGLHDLYGLISFLGCEEYSSLSVWRAAMRSSTPEGLGRLKSLLRRLMWRHSKAHVLDEVCLPQISHHKIYLTFSNIELKNYEYLENKLKSSVITESHKMEDRTAMMKLESLRKACAHPQTAADTIFGQKFLPLFEIGGRLEQEHRNSAHMIERDLCRAMNRLALEYLRQGQRLLAERTFVESWRIADSGISGEAEKEEPVEEVSITRQTSNPQSSSKSSKSKRASTGPSDPMALNSKPLDLFDSDTKIVTKNTELRQWRIIELVTCYQLALLYRDQLKQRFNRDVDTRPIEMWRESCTETFDRLMQETAQVIPAFIESGMEIAKMADSASDLRLKLPPQLDIKNGEVETSASDSENALLLKYQKQSMQFEYNLHDLFDVHELKLIDSAQLIGLTYEVELLPAAVATSAPEVRDLYEDRKRVGVETFNRLSQPYMQRIAELMPLYESDREQQEMILTMYDLQRSKLLIHELQLKLEDGGRRSVFKAVIDEFQPTQLFQRHVTQILKESFPLLHSIVCRELDVLFASSKPLSTYRLSRTRIVRHFPSLDQLYDQWNDHYTKHIDELNKADAKIPPEAAKEIRDHLKLYNKESLKAMSDSTNSASSSSSSSKPYYQPVERKSKKPPRPKQARENRAIRTFDEQLRRQLAATNGAITKRWNKLPDELQQQIEEEDDMKYTDFSQCSHREKYDQAWHMARDSLQSLRIMKEVRSVRSKIRGYIKKFLMLRLTLLRDHGIITQDDANKYMDVISKETFVEEEKAPVDPTEEPTPSETKPKPRPSPKKKKKPDEEEEEEKKELEPVADLDDADMPDIAIPSSTVTPSSTTTAAAASTSSSAFVDTETAVSYEDIRSAKIARLQREIQLLQTRAKSIASTLQFSVAQIQQNPRMLNDHQCSICHSAVSTPVITICCHIFDAECLQDWLRKKKSPTCPCCRHPLDPQKDVMPVEFNREKKEDDDEEEEKKESHIVRSISSQQQHANVSSATLPSTSAAAAGHRTPVPIDSITLPSESDIHRMTIVGEGRVGSKIETVVKYVTHLHRLNPNVKVLIFSQYQRILTMVHDALLQNHLKSLLLQGTPKQRADQIDQFQTNESYTAFLLSLRTDNSGLTLVQSNFVFLMEPSLTPSMEHQAINRIHRIGQQQACHVFKFLMRDSVEQRIDELITTPAAATGTATHAQDDATMESAAQMAPGDDVAQRNKESLSVAQLLNVLHLSSDQDQREKEELEAIANVGTSA